MATLTLQNILLHAEIFHHLPGHYVWTRERELEVFTPLFLNRNPFSTLHTDTVRQVRINLFRLHTQINGNRREVILSPKDSFSAFLLLLSMPKATFLLPACKSIFFIINHRWKSVDNILRGFFLKKVMKTIFYTWRLQIFAPWSTHAHRCLTEIVGSVSMFNRPSHLFNRLN